jgi:hypothetical protein
VYLVALLCLLVGAFASGAHAAYSHGGSSTTDAQNVLSAYPKLKNTKLDNCALCHTGGKAGKKTYGSCQWCHYISDYGNDSSQYAATLNSYGVDYKAAGQSKAALTAIETKDSDGDGYTNITEINAIRYPGDATDDPTKVVAPYRVYTKKQLQAMPQHKQFMLMNTTKSGDYYAEYSGVIMEDFLKRVGISSSATKITVYSPDGYAITHPLNDSSDNTGTSYSPYVNGTYPVATYFYTTEADTKLNSAYGWCNYSSAGNQGRKNGDTIAVDNGLRLLLALQMDGVDLIPGSLGSDNKLAGEGPFRTITPQKVVGPPDQPSTNPTQGAIWQFDANADHNAGFSTKSATMIKVEPLPAGTTDIDTYEAGWKYVDEGKVVVYGALDGPALVSPINGASTPINATILTWMKYADPDPDAKVTYTVEVSTDQTNWTTVSTKVSSAPTAQKTLLAGAGKFMLFGLIGSIAVGVPRRSRKYLGLVLVIAMTGATISACGVDHRINTTEVNAMVPAGTLQANTTYYWRVTADGPNSHAVSDTSTFITTP